MEKYIEKFCGISIFTWNRCDQVDDDAIYFYNVQFLIPSMEKYNGHDVLRQWDGALQVDSEDGKEYLWKGYVTDIPEVIESLVRRQMEKD